MNQPQVSACTLALLVLLSSTPTSIAAERFDILARLRAPTGAQRHNDDSTIGFRPTSDFRSEWILESPLTTEERVDLSPANTYLTQGTSSRRLAPQRMPGEFEPQTALLVAGGRMVETAPEVLADLIWLTSDYVPLLMMVNQGSDPDLVRSRIDPALHERLLSIQHNTIWTRDYGPVVLSDADGTPVVVDAAYSDADRTQDDAVPSAVARLSMASTRHSSLNLSGGNLLSNGAGICITTTRLQDENPGVSQETIAGEIAENYCANVVVFLEPLQDEATGHVDMFATFTDRGTIVVGMYDLLVEKTNGEILDRNAARLSALQIGNRPLRVVRVPMPARRDELWPTFTNVVYANGRLLVPSYEFSTPRELQLVRSTYERLLPGWEIHFIRVDSLIASGGALHCVVSNLGPLQLGRPRESVEKPTERSKFRRPRLAFQN